MSPFLLVSAFAAGYASRWFRTKTQAVRKHAMLGRLAGGFLLISLGLFIAFQGSYSLGSLF